MALDYRQPNLSAKDARHLSKTLYNVTAVEEVKELSSYSDRNFYIKGTRLEGLKSETRQTQGEFVLKILNSVDSKNEQLVAAENFAIDFLRKRGFPCPQVCCIKGSTKRALAVCLPVLYERDTKQVDQNANDFTERCIVRLVTLVPGETLDNFVMSQTLLNNVGKFIGAVSRSLMVFSHPAITKRYDRCDLKNFLDLKPYISLVSSPRDRKIASEIFMAFASQVAPYISQMRHGTIHNDMNTQNILGSPDNNGSLSITGLIDFGDITYSMVVNDVVVAMVSFMGSGPRELEVSGHLLAGYQASFPIPVMEYKMLYILTAARICQIYLVSNQTLGINSGNCYVKELRKSYGRLMGTFWSHPKEEVENIWLKCRETLYE